MGVYAVTGSASGMGQAVVDELRADGHTVIGIDVAEAEIRVDLSTADGRREAVERVLAAAHGRLDGAVLAAGIGPTPGKGRARMIYEVNYLGVVELLEGWRDALASAPKAKVVVFGSNSTTTTPAVPRRAIRALLASDLDRAERVVAIFGKVAPSIAYAASKIAVSRWARRTAVTPKWAGAGIRLNVLAPGAIATPLLQRQLGTPSEAKAIRSFPIPVGGFGEPKELARWVVFMLSDAANFLCGSVVFVDGGSDAFFRADDWPKPVSVGQIFSYAKRFRSHSRRNRNS